MSNVHSLWGQPTGERKAEPDVIKALEGWLEKAKSGEIVGVCVTAIYADGLAGYGLSGQMGGYAILGAIEQAKSVIVDINRDD